MPVPLDELIAGMAVGAFGESAGSESTRQLPKVLVAVIKEIGHTLSIACCPDSSRAVIISSNCV